MAKYELHDKAVQLRKQGMSYSQIKGELNVSKATLSIWLREYPLSEERIRQLRDFNQQRIEKYRNTREKTRKARQVSVKAKVREELFPLTDREILISGLFLYWGEGTKTASATVSVSNADPAVLGFFVNWLEVLKVPRYKIKVYLHLYSDMDIEIETRFWSETLGLPRSAFRKPYIKGSKRTGLTYFQRFTHGTCNVIYGSRDLHEYVLAALELIRSEFANTSSI